ncbi:hypothetical protein COCCADRAFT_90547 [Bipolaris zeicola 26-R-13]|uniref:Uncharacterized protein n=1 Tax=Cochliobolus carbonum (strain 26-R-13) TaxID=930089 RepID=W6Y7I0_COCC2|nr:uncharacterized protein COCCADRAFT_90547 [Bipolaris zeicola 26-R-13]EUC35572.1 hypothetical protein COCCADRAFT_90547 [Bipolaris zeicola 26-R-13]
MALAISSQGEGSTWRSDPKRASSAGTDADHYSSSRWPFASHYLLVSTSLISSPHPLLSSHFHFC